MKCQQELQEFVIKHLEKQEMKINKIVYILHVINIYIYIYNNILL